ncbi:bile acid-CoA:amino acid N-acyltransferase isoform X2 [Erinaceus europaeus]|nr:bile acid-CoA:amino acid N-acyltransferase isoform X2 [Erinaceus europaeus]
MLQLTVTPASALVDEPVHIQVTGLLPSQMVTFKLSVKDDKGNLFHSRAFYKADETGKVDLQRHPSLGGDYVGLHPMGLFWSLKPEKMFGRLLKRDVNRPWEATVDLYDSVNYTESTLHPMEMSQTVQRWFIAPDVKREQVKAGRIRGALFLPPGEGPFPAVIDMFGSIGGLVEFRASLLASRGFATLALAYFAYEDLPTSLLELDLEYFEEAANFLVSHPKTQGPGIGVIGVSKGAEIALAMACYLKQVVATICINGPTAVCDASLRYKDEVHTPTSPHKEYVEFDLFRALRFRNYLAACEDELSEYNFLPVEKAEGQILFIIGEDDQCLQSKLLAEKALNKLRRQGKNNGKMLAYPGAGHLIEPPYTPLCYSSWSPGFPYPLLWGGEMVAHSVAQEQSWREILNFFREHLPGARNKL